MNQIPFNLYDWLAYLGPGFLAAYCVQDALSVSIPEPGSFYNIVFWVFASYFMGHIVAHFSQIFIEDVLVGRIIGKPEYYLLGGKTFWNFLLPKYTQSLPDTQVEVILRTTGGSISSSRDVFHKAFFSVKSETEMKARLDTFIAQYGALRNMAFAIFTFTMIGWITDALQYDIADNQIPWMVFVSILLFLRFLKFYRIYTREVLGTFGAKYS